MPVRDLLSAASTQGASPADPYFYDVSLLLNGDGTNGAQNNTFLDSSTNNFTITRNGNTTQGSFSPYGSLWSNYFNSGNSSYLSVPDNAALKLGTNSFTMEAWVFPTSFASTYAVLSKMTSSGTASGFLFNVSSSSGLLLFYASSNGSSWDIVSALGSINLALNSWNHIAVGRSGSTFRLWVNGSSSGTATSSGSIENNSASVLIGAAGQSSTANFANSYISNARIVNGTDVYGVSNSTITVPTAPLTAVTNTSLLTCQSNRFIDNSTNNFTVTPNGTPSVQRFSPFNPTAPYSTSVIGGSGYFDGSGDYLTVPNSSALQLGSGDFTIEMWTNFSSLAANNGLLYYASTYDSQFSYGLQWASNALYFWYSTSGGAASYLSASWTPVTNAWYHVAVCRSGSSLYFFINGTQIGSTQTLSVTLYNTSANMLIGGQLGGSSGSLPGSMYGYISNLRIVKGTAVYTANFTPPTAPVTAISGTQLLTNFTNAGIPDLAMMNNLETVGTAQVSTSVKKYGTGSLSFNGSGSYLVTTDTSKSQLYDVTGAFTLECWVYLNANTNGNIFNKGGGSGSWSTSNGHEYLLFMSSGTLYWMWNAGGSNTQITTSSPSTGSWHSLIVGYNGTTTRFWVDGTSVGTSTTGYTLPTTRNITSIGINPDLTTYPLNGYVDDLRFTQGLDRYGVGNSTITPPTSALPTY